MHLKLPMLKKMIESTTFTLRQGNSPLLISIPHGGTVIPDDMRSLYTPEALSLADTDWHLETLYAFAERYDATIICAKYSRYIIDLNRPANGESLYPGMVTTTLCPTESFRGGPLYREGLEPDDAEIARRVDAVWHPYHSMLKDEIARLRALHPDVLLWEAHSIASLLPRLFSGKLPDFNFGTSDGQSCTKAVIASAVNAVRDKACSWVLNGRFKGGFITRKYGDPANGVHAIQLELCQSLYMEEFAPFEWRADLAERVTPIIESSVASALRTMQRARGYTEGLTRPA